MPDLQNICTLVWKGRVSKWQVRPLNPYSAGIDFGRQNMTSVRIWSSENWSSEYDVCRRQILTTKVDPRTVRVKLFLMAVDS